VKSSLSLGKIAGIKVSIHWTFVILLAWIVYVNYQVGATSQELLWSIIYVMSIFVCVVMHEYGHALTARRFNIGTRDITLYPIGGIASLESIPKKPKEELLVALAGPAVNVVIAAILFPFIDRSLIFESAGFTQISASNFLTSFVTVNIWLVLFNMIPAFPMDGGRVFRALLAFKLERVKATRIAAGLGQFLAMGFMLLGIYTNPFLIVIGVFIFFGAQAEARHAQTEFVLEGNTIQKITMRNYPALSGNSILREAIDLTLTTQQKNFVVVDGSQIIGTMSQSNIIRSLRDHQDDVKLADVMDRNLLYMPVTTPMEEALQKMKQEDKSMAIVTENDMHIGIIDSDNLIEFILIQQARGKE
jgi:Zn-dependent protease/predicted transcriptional regulator